MNIKENIYQLNFMWNFSKWKKKPYEKIFKRSCWVAEMFLKYHKTQAAKKKKKKEELGQMTVLKDNQDKVTQLIHRIKVILKVA